MLTLSPVLPGLGAGQLGSMPIGSRFVTHGATEGVQTEPHARIRVFSKITLVCGGF
jgi:hypothetical protein